MWTVAPVVILVLIGGFVFYKLPGIADVPSASARGEERLDVRVTGRQYYWQYEYANGAVAIDTLRAPVGVPVRLEVTAPDEDVIHSWWIPALGGKIDAIPGVVNETWFEAERPVSTRGSAQSCAGSSTRTCSPRSRSSTAEQFDAWLAERESRAGKRRARRGGVGRRLRQVPRPRRRRGNRAADRGIADPRRSRSRWRRSSVTGAETCPRSAPSGRTSRSTPWSPTSRRTRPVAVRAEGTPAWQRGRLASWLVTTDHKRIGILYIGTALAFFVLAGIMAMLMRLQLAQAEADLIGPDRYNELLTIHGTSMIFLVVVPLLTGFANFLLPLHDRRTRRRVPAAERALVLALRLRRPRAHALLLRRRRGREVGLDGLRAALHPIRRGTGRTSGSSRCTSSPPRLSRARSTSSSRSTTCVRAG